MTKNNDLILQEKPQIYGNMLAVMSAVGAIAKTKIAMGYKFRGIDDVYNELHRHMADCKVLCIPSVLEERTEERQSKGGANLIYRVLRVSFTFYAQDGSSVESIVIGEGMDSGDKASNKAMSVAQKYALIQAFCIPTIEAKDPEIDSHEALAKSASPSPHAKAEGFDPNHEAHVRWLKDAMKKHGVPGYDDEDEIKEAIKLMTGKPSSYFNELYEEHLKNGS